MAIVTVARLADLPVGAHVELEGVLRGVDPVRGPVSGRTLTGCSVLCSLFGEAGDYLGRRDVERWADATLDDGTGQVTVALSTSPLRAPATRETTVHGDDLAPMLRELRLDIEGVHELQLLERGIDEGARVRVRGALARLATPDAGAFRSNARPPLGLVGERGAPIVLTPR